MSRYPREAHCGAYTSLVCTDKPDFFFLLGRVQFSSFCRAKSILLPDDIENRGLQNSSFDCEVKKGVANSGVFLAEAQELLVMHLETTTSIGLPHLSKLRKSERARAIHA